MSDVQETAQMFCVSAAVAVVLCVSIFNMRSCTENMDTQREKTKQEAIKAGLVEGEQGRWAKPAETPSVEGLQDEL